MVGVEVTGRPVDDGLHQHQERLSVNLISMKYTGVNGIVSPLV